MKLKNLYYFLPVQLLIINLRKNQFILLLWILLFAIITSNFGNRYGLPYLYLDPEYLNKVDFWSLFIVGLAFGIFAMAYNITMYISESFQFQFLALYGKPFAHFCYNNLFLPLLFIIVFSYNFIHFQLINSFKDTLTVLWELFGFLLGATITAAITILIFRHMSRHIFSNITQTLNKKMRRSKLTRVQIIKKVRYLKNRTHHTEKFLDFPFKISKVSDFDYYDRDKLTRAFDQKHIFAFLFEIAGFIVLLILGYFQFLEILQIPAAATLLIFVSVIIMLMGAFTYWFKGWSLYIFILLVICFNFLVRWGVVNPNYEVHGIKYDTTKAQYTNERIEHLNSIKNYVNDYYHTRKTLNNWKSKFDDKKPKIVLLCTSGGGQRAATWTMRSLQVADSSLNGKLFKHTATITGASGGIIGAAYYRELYLRKTLGKNINLYNDKYFRNISKDILNPVAFSMIFNDMFLRFNKFSPGQYEHPQDRGFAFENQLNQNTKGIMSRKVMDYKPFEKSGIIPMMIITPTVVNDGRKLYISPQKMSYMNGNALNNRGLFNYKTDGIEFMRFFETQEADKLSFLSALRMSATFPYITPNVHLPSNPPMEIMDAGLADNFGITEAVRFLYVFRRWVNENTDGVIIVSIRDSGNDIPIEKNINKNIISKTINPIGTLYRNWDNLQDSNNENYLEFANSWLDCPLDVVRFEYVPIPFPDEKEQEKLSEEMYLKKSEKERASLSWHLTKKEKESLKQTIYNSNNQQAIKKLKRLLK